MARRCASTQFHADSALHVQQLRKPGRPGWTPEREALIEELTGFVLRDCDIVS